MQSALVAPRPLAFPQRDLLARLGEVAQLVEHTTENRGVAGSNPALAILLLPEIGASRAMANFG